MADGKATLPLLHALKHGTPSQQKLIKRSIQEGSLQNLTEILTAIKETKAIEFTRSYAELEVDKALSALQCLPVSVYKNALEELALFAVKREH